MASTSSTRTTRSDRSFPTLAVLLILLIVASAGFGWWYWQNRPGANQRANYELVNPQRGALNATINASGTMQPNQVSSLAFAVPGSILEIPVERGQQVPAGTLLARLDTRQFELDIESAEAGLMQAQANYDRLASGASSEEIAVAQAQVNQAMAQRQQAVGSVTDEDLMAAEAQLEQARARLAALEAGATPESVRAAQAQLDLAIANLETQRDTLSAAKTNARMQMEQAANELRNKQDDYSRIYWQTRILRDRGDDLPQFLIDREAEALRDVQNTQLLLSQAQVNYNQAREAEISGIAAAEAQVRSAQANLDALIAPSNPADIAAARAQISQAEANLAKLRGTQRSGSIAAADAAVDVAQANLEQLGAGADPSDLTGALARVRQAETALKQAELVLDQTRLVAPFDGTIAAITATAGASVAPNQPIMAIADLSRFHVDVTVDEIDVAQIVIGQEAILSLDALPDLELRGEVTYIDPLAADLAGVSSYKLRLEIDAVDERVRSGMSANVDVIVAQKEDVLMVPLRAVRLEGNSFVVNVTADPALCTLDRTQWPADPELRTVPITTGLASDEMTEVLEGDLDEEDCVYLEGFDARLDLLDGPPPPSLRQRRQQ